MTSGTTTSDKDNPIKINFKRDYFSKPFDIWSSKMNFIQKKSYGILIPTTKTPSILF